MINNPMFDLADELKRLRDRKTELEAQVKAIGKKIEDTDYRLGELMAETETQNFTRAGTMFYLVTKTHASAIADNKDELFKAMRKNGFDSLITETVNANKLSSFVKEQIEENGDALPGWLSGLVKVFDKTNVGVRNAPKH